MVRAVRLPFRDGRDIKLTISRPSRHDTVMPLTELADVVADGVAVTIADARAVDGNVSPYEGLVLSGIVASRRPGRIFELGTFDGRTTLMLAANAPQAQLFTLDLPAAEIDDAALTIGAGHVRYIAKSTIGARILASPVNERITMLEGDSASFDYAPYEGTIDLVFVDACHEYDYVLSDSRVAMRLLGPTGGTIVWHDYAVWTGVTRALNELRASPPFTGLRRVRDTTLVVLDVPALT